MDMIAEYLKISNEILNYLNSDLDLNSKLDNVDILIEERGNLIRQIDSKSNSLPSKENYEKIIYIDGKIADKINVMMKEKANKISELISERVLADKKNKVNKMYKDYNNDSGYFINEKK